jgi:hypothetical protein
LNHQLIADQAMGRIGGDDQLLDGRHNGIELVGSEQPTNNAFFNGVEQISDQIGEVVQDEDGARNGRIII